LHYGDDDEGGRVLLLVVVLGVVAVVEIEAFVAAVEMRGRWVVIRCELVAHIERRKMGGTIHQRQDGVGGEEDDEDE
jgi:hypothetical protein